MNMLYKELLAIACGGALGSVCRFLLSRWVQSIAHYQDFPWGIFVVNVLGSLLMGILTGILIHRLQLDPVWRAAILVGVLGGFTTFSSFSIDTITLMQYGDIAAALWNIVLTVVVCLTASAGGLLITRTLFLK